MHPVWLGLLLLATFPRAGNTHADLEPEFAQLVPNISVPVGTDVTLPCVVENLGSYRVAWIRFESQTILSIHRNVITRNYRVSLDHNDHQHWNLRISNVQEADRGGYMCQVNTVPMRSLVGYLEVLVPPSFVDPVSNSEVLARESTNVTLTCRVRGHPLPSVTWRREDGKTIVTGNCQGVTFEETCYEGEELTVVKVSRLHMGAYLCSASNGVPPSISRKIMLQVNFPPMIWIPNQLIGSLLDGNVTMECYTEAYPMSINYWTKEDRGMIVNSKKYTTSLQDNTYKVHMKLVVRSLQRDDYGTYKCYAKNSLGTTQGSIRLYQTDESNLPVREPSTTEVLREDGMSSVEPPLLQESLKRRPNERFPMLDDSLPKGQTSASDPLPKRPRKVEASSSKATLPRALPLSLLALWFLAT